MAGKSKRQRFRQRARRQRLERARKSPEFAHMMIAGRLMDKHDLCRYYIDKLGNRQKGKALAEKLAIRKILSERTGHAISEADVRLSYRIEADRTGAYRSLYRGSHAASLIS